jgi:hypothetical protein
MASTRDKPRQLKGVGFIADSDFTSSLATLVPQLTPLQNDKMRNDMPCSLPEVM